MSSASVIGVLVPFQGDSPTLPPESRPIGRAALHLQDRGIDIIFGDEVSNGCIHGFRAIHGGWERADNIPLDAAHDRFPSQLRATQFATIRQGLGPIPMGNSLDFTMLCRDKLKSQMALTELGIKMPAVCHEPSRFASRLDAWGSAFLKPRFGALGVGVERVEPGAPLPASRPGIVPDRPDPSILQQAIQPPKGWASRTVRVLMQRGLDGQWLHGTPVVRQSRVDPVANAARGAEVACGTSALAPEIIDRIIECMRTIGHAIDQLDGAMWALEAGVDLVLDADYVPWLIELNSRPRGRMEVLADQEPGRFGMAHLKACCRPIERLSRIVEQES